MGEILEADSFDPTGADGQVQCPASQRRDLGDFRKTLAEKEGITRWWFHPGLFRVHRG